MTDLYAKAVNKCFDFGKHWDQVRPHLSNEDLIEEMQECIEEISTFTGYKYDPSLPPICVLTHMDTFQCNVERIAEQLKLKEFPDAINDDLSLALRNLPLQDEFTFDVEFILRKAGYRQWLTNCELTHSLENLTRFYKLDPHSIYWFIMPHFCIPWNTDFGFCLAKLFEPEEQWQVILCENNSHATVVSLNGIFFDLLAWLNV